MRSCNCKTGVLPLPLRYTSTNRESEPRLPCEEHKPLFDKSENGVDFTKLKTTASSDQGNLINSLVPMTKPQSSINDPHFADVLVSLPFNLRASDTETALLFSHITESDFVSDVNQSPSTKLNRTNNLAVGLLDLSISSLGLVVCMREAWGQNGI